MKCPKCNLEIPPSAERCDCGYEPSDWERNRMERSQIFSRRSAVLLWQHVLRPQDAKGWSRMILLVLILFIVIYAAIAPTESLNTATGSSATASASSSTAALVSALNTWWQGQFDGIPQPEKIGTVTPAHTIFIPNLRKDIHVKRHVQTKAEYEEQVKDVEWAGHMRTLVTGFRVLGDTVYVLTTAIKGSTYARIEGDDKREAQDVCHQMGAFVWANDNRHWGLENIKVLGANEQLLTSRMGIAFSHGQPTGCR